jgi:hypothetical protein
MSALKYIGVVYGRGGAQEGQTIIEQQEASDLTVVDFCEQISRSTKVVRVTADRSFLPVTN